MEDLGMKKICVKMVPKLLSDARHVDLSWDVLEHLEGNPEFLDNVITGDKTWVFQYNPETKQQSLQWKTAGSPRPKKAHMSKSKMKVMLIATTRDWFIMSLCHKGKL